ncbi:hypothetical protein LCGC14_1755060 [marine sediment metagenome]|uniref:Uncharacterized protein n=1 Tax=marine sediment metagenome TaxID=412755 RepID=A0A0F9H2T0_9ZZZZ|nr:hypothetical protein [bacterium]
MSVIYKNKKYKVTELASPDLGLNKTFKMKKLRGLKISIVYPYLMISQISAIHRFLYKFMLRENLTDLNYD